MNSANSRILQSGREPTIEFKNWVLRHIGEPAACDTGLRSGVCSRGFAADRLWKGGGSSSLSVSGCVPQH